MHGEYTGHVSDKEGGLLNICQVILQVNFAPARRLRLHFSGVLCIHKNISLCMIVCMC